MRGSVKIVLIALYNPISFEIRGFHSLLKEKGYEVHSIFLKEIKSTDLDVPTKKEYALLKEKVEAEKPDLVAIAVRSSFLKIADNITRDIRPLGIPVVWGGIHITLCPEDSIERTDIICLGEGEEALLELCEHIDKKQDYCDIQNLWVKKNGKIIRNPVRSLTQNLDKYPFPHFSDEETTFIENNTAYPGYYALNPYAKKELMVLSGRWCPYNCTFCCNSYLHKLYPGRMDRRRTVANVIKNLEWLKKEGFESFYFMDEVFSKDKAWLEEFCSEYKKKINRPFKCLYHPTDVDDERTQKLHDAGLCMVSLGIQSGSERTRKELYWRPGTNQQILETIHVLNKYGVGICLDLILDNQLESFEDKMETVKLFLKIPRGYQLNMYSLVYFPNTKLAEIALERGIITREQLEGTADSAIKNWGGGWQVTKGKEDQFIDALIFLIARTNISKKIINRFSQSRFLRSNPLPLTALANSIDYCQINLTKYINYAMVSKKMIFNGELPILMKLASKKMKRS